MATQANKNKGSGSSKEGSRKSEVGGNWMNKYKQAMKTPNGIKTVMSVLAEEYKTNKTLIASFQSTQTPDATPATNITVIKSPATCKPLICPLQACFLATSVKPQSILESNGK